MNEQQLLARISELAGDQRRETFLQAARYILWHKHKHIVETGCYRGIGADGESTTIFGLLAQHLGGCLDSVDINPEHIAKAKAHCVGLPIVFNAEDSVGFLERQECIDFLYLDSYDYEVGNPLPCQQHQRQEFHAALPRLSSHAGVLLDDYNDHDGGKTRLSATMLEFSGFHKTASGYQLFYTR